MDQNTVCKRMTTSLMEKGPSEAGSRLPDNEFGIYVQNSRSINQFPCQSNPARTHIRTHCAFRSVLVNTRHPVNHKRELSWWFRYSLVWRSVAVWMVPDVSKEHLSSSRRIFFCDHLTNEDESTTFLRNVGNRSPDRQSRPAKTWIIRKNAVRPLRLVKITELGIE